MRKLILVVIAGILLSSCSTIGYYWQAASGEIAILNKRESIQSILNKQNTEDNFRQQLQLIERARSFASSDLLLPDNDSYRYYADLQRPYAIWNVIAAPKLSIEPKEWCFLIAGCVNYRGYFLQQDAQAFADELHKEGLDVYVGGVAAYSTLGYFDDPVLSTMLRKDEGELIGLLFHELAHQLIYIKNDSAFNEAFATAVAQEGVRRWFNIQNKPVLYQQYLDTAKEQEEFQQILTAARDELANCYSSSASDAVKLNCKQTVFNKLGNSYHVWRQHARFINYDRWMAQPLNNAHLALMSTYNKLVPNFKALLDKNHGEMKDFYSSVRQLAKLSKQERLEQLHKFTESKFVNN